MLLDQVVASFATLADYGGVGDGFLKEEKLLMGRSDKSIAYVVNGIISLLQARKLQGTGYGNAIYKACRIKEITQPIIENFIDIISYFKGISERAGEFAKACLTCEAAGNDNALRFSLSNSATSLLTPLRQLNSAICTRMSLILV